eukprot:2888956-Alexandrium_andersonii.AAC.1
MCIRDSKNDGLWFLPNKFLNLHTPLSVYVSSSTVPIESRAWRGRETRALASPTVDSNSDR